MLVLFTDTDTDITPEICKEYGYKLISMPYSIDGKITYPYVDFDKFDGKTFYDQLRAGTLPTTSAVSKEQYIQYFEPYFKNGDDILYVHFSRAMTATFDNMDQAVAELKEKYPTSKFYEIDTKAITTLSYCLVREIGDLYKQGKSAEEILAWADKEVLHYAIYFFADDLKFFKRSGRVSGLAATMGTLLGIRPIIHMDENGKMVSVGSEVGRNKVINKIMATIDELGDDVKGHRVIIGHTDAYDLAKLVEQKLKDKFGQDLNTEIQIVNPTAGSHCGPNGVGIVFHSKAR